MSDQVLDLCYRIGLDTPESHLFDLELTIRECPSTPLVVSLPAWIPGSYMIRDFARNIVEISAADAQGQPLALHKRDKQTWVCEHPPAVCVLRYRVFAWDLSVRSAHFDTTHAYFNGPSVFLQVQGMEGRRCMVQIDAPTVPCGASWQVATSLSPAVVDTRGFGRYQADDYQDLIDHPVEIADLVGTEFEVEGVRHRLAISGRQYADLARLREDLTAICTQHARMFGELPLDRYVFLTRATADGYGGLEHRFSSSLMCARNDLRCRNDQEREGYQRFLGLCSHEYFHLWNVKRIRPEVFRNPDLSREVHTRLLWAFEGITSYYDDLALVRSGRIEVADYLKLLAQLITRVMRTPGRHLQTVAESSFDAWTKFYLQDANAPNAIVSYYTKGALVALCLDLLLRRETRGRCSLDDVMRALWQKHGQTSSGVSEHGIEAVAAEVSGLDLGGFFARALDGTDDLDLDGMLASVGVGMRLRPTTGGKDTGGYVDSFDTLPAAAPTLNIRLRSDDSLAVVQNVLSGGAGEHAGLAPGDVIVAIHGLRATAANCETLLAQQEAGAVVPIHFFRGDELLETTARLQAPLPDTCELTLLPASAGELLQARTAWLASVE